MPSSIRPAFAALWALDLAFADVVATSSDARLGAIRLAWWRERLDELEGSAPAEPRLQSVAKHLLQQDVTGADLSLLEDAWAPMLAPLPWGQEQIEGFRQRGRLLFGIGARLLGASPEVAEAAGCLWSLYDGAFHCSDGRSREMLVGAAREAVAALPSRVPAKVRQLTVLGALAAADVVGRARGIAALKHRLVGTFPR